MIYQWHDPTPNNTCPVCAWLNGRHFAHDNLLPIPAHPGCECQYILATDTNAQPLTTLNNAPDHVRQHFTTYGRYLQTNGHHLTPIMETTMTNLTATEPTQRIALNGRITLALTDKPHEFRARLISAGRTRNTLNQPGPYLITPQAIQTAIQEGQFNAVAAFIDHAQTDHPSLKNLLGTWRNIQHDPIDNSAIGTLRAYNNDQTRATIEMLRQIAEDQSAGIPTPDIGISLVFFAESAPRHDPNDPITITRFRKIESADLVFLPAVENGRILEALSVNNQKETQPMTDPTPTPTAEPTPQTAVPAPAADDASQWLSAIRQDAVRAKILATDLPPQVQKRLLAGSYTQPAELETAINDARTELASLAEDGIIDLPGPAPRGADIEVGLDGLSRLELAAEALLNGTRPSGNIRPLSGIRELYLLLSGDYEMHGTFNPDKVRFSSVNTSTMAGLVANAMNKRLTNTFQAMPQWWQPAVTEESFNTLQDVRWITLGGIGELPTVAEGAAYSELAWDDQTETNAFVKKGGYLGITLEAIDKDDTRAIQAAPRALARAAWITLGKAIAAIFTANSHTGPTMSDSTVLFHADHANIGSTALSFASWDATRIAMEKQTELNSGERLGGLNSPKLLWVPTDLETTAVQVLASTLDPREGTTTSYQAENPFAEGDARTERLRLARQRIVKVPFWTDTNNWAAQADPLMYPSIGLGYRFGRTPEIYSVASPTAGLMFTNDVMPVKVRFFFAVGPTDWRGLYKHNVA